MVVSNSTKAISPPQTAGAPSAFSARIFNLISSIPPKVIKIPPGTQNGQKLRLRGRGLPDRNGGHGDVIVVARVEVPSQVSESERKLWEQLARESPFKPRE